MIPTNNITPTGESEESQNANTSGASSRPISPTADEGQRGKPFKDVLNEKLAKKNVKQATKNISNEEEGEIISPFDLAAQTRARKMNTGEQESSADLLASEEEEQALSMPTEDLASAETPMQVATPAVQSDKINTPVVMTSTQPMKNDDKADVAVITTPVATPVTKEKKEEPIIPQVNLAAVPLTPPIEAPVAAAVTAPKEPTNTREVFIKLAAQMISQLEKVTTPGKTDTTITLQYPPLFKDAQILITEYSTSQKQFNLTFSGLSPQARALVEMQSNQTSLRQALIDKGYTMQTITIEQKIPGLQSVQTGEVATEEKGAQRDTTQEDDQRFP